MYKTKYVEMESGELMSMLVVRRAEKYKDTIRDYLVKVANNGQDWFFTKPHEWLANVRNRDVLCKFAKKPKGFFGAFPEGKWGF